MSLPSSSVGWRIEFDAKAAYRSVSAMRVCPPFLLSLFWIVAELRCPIECGGRGGGIRVD